MEISKVKLPDYTFMEEYNMELDDSPGTDRTRSSKPDFFTGQYTATANTSRFSFTLSDTVDELRVVDFKGIETISRPYEYHVTLATRNDLLDDSSFMARTGRLSLVFDEHREYLHGEVAAFEYLHEQGDFVLYRLTLVPKFWFLSKRYNQRIFRKRSVPQIIKQVLTEAGLSARDYELRLAQSYPEHDYRVQYNESEMDFLARLMQEEGLNYHFEHASQTYLMVITDQNNAFPVIQGNESVQYHPQSGQNQRFNVINSLDYRVKTRFGKASLRDYNFVKPSDRLDTEQQADTDPALEDYHYPGHYHTVSAGGRNARLKLEQHQSTRALIDFNSNHYNLRAGHRFSLYDNPNDQFNQSYLLISIEHSGTQPQALDEFGAGSQASYQNHCRGIPLTVPYRTSCQTRRPKITGYHSAVITGAEGEEIYTNEHAQSKVQFPWDREGQLNEHSSCWLRSTQGWAGNKWGSLILPRMGQEAKIGFIHGDPDRPVITGRVYHELNQAPYTLPRHKTRSSIKSNSTVGGQGYNEIRMEDKKDHEQVYFHAQKDMDIRVKQDRRDVIQHDRHLIVNNNRYEHIKQNTHHSIGQNQNEQTGQNLSLSIGQNLHEHSGQAILTEVAQNIHFKSGRKIILEAGVELTIKAGGGFIKIDPSGITAQGTRIDFNGSGGVSSATLAAPQKPAVAAEADKDKPGQSFKAILPQLSNTPEAIHFKGDIARFLQAASDNKQGICIPCMLKQTLAQESTNTEQALPENKINTHPHDPLPPEAPAESDQKHWLELQHSLVYKEDQGQVEAAKKASYTLTSPEGKTITGQLDDAGKAQIKPIPSGIYTVEYEPGIETEIYQKQDEIRQILDAIIADEQKEARAIEQKLQDARLFDMEFPGSNALAQYEMYKAAGVRGLWNGLTGLANLAWDVLNGAGSLMYELALRSNPVTAPIKFQQDLQALKAAHQELQQFADEDLELYAALMSDEDTHKILKDFASDYLAAQHSLEYAETGGQVLFDILLTLVTAGFGAAASARHLAKLKKLKPLLQKLAKLLKRKRFKTSKKGTHDSRIDSKNVLKFNKSTPRKTEIDNIIKSNHRYRDNLDGKWFKDNGELSWPKNDGFIGKPKRKILKKGEIIDRYSSKTGVIDRGFFLSPVNTPYASRALPYDLSKMKYAKYEVVHEFEVNSGKVLPWFDEKGGGTQYQTDISVRDLIKQGFLREVK